jgi:hypothetical protein
MTITLTLLLLGFAALILGAACEWLRSEREYRKGRKL